MTDRPIALDLQDIHKSYGALEVLKGVSLTAYDGDVISILGSSGSGKSTFLRCINFLELPDQGRIQLGQDVVEAIPDGFVLFDRDERLLTCNQRYREIYGH